MGVTMAPQTGPKDAIPESCTPVVLPKLDSSRARELASAFKALADPTRVQIVSLLLDADEQGRCVCDIGLNFPLGQSTISHHLKTLRDAGLVRASKKGLWVFYSVDRERLARLVIALPGPRAQAERSKSRDEACDCDPAGRGSRPSEPLLVTRKVGDHG